MKKLLFPFVLALTGSQVQGAEEASSLLVGGGMQAVLALKNDFFIEISDQVGDGCLPNPQRLKDNLEIVLRQNGFGIKSEDEADAGLTLTALGYSVSPSNCAVFIRLDLTAWAVIKVPYAQDLPGGSETFAQVMPGQLYDNLLTGPVSSIQGRLEEAATDAGNNFFLYMSRARDHVKEKFPAIIEKQKSFEASQ